MFDGMNGSEPLVVYWMCASLTSELEAFLKQSGEGKRIKKHS
jgi:hypothetical protein